MDSQYSPVDISDSGDLFDSAKQSLNQSKQMGVTKDQLDQLKQHESANMWTNIFMNLVGAARNIDPAPYTKPLNQAIDTQRQNLSLQDQLAQRASQQGINQQNFGMNQIKASQELATANYLNSPVGKPQKGIAYAMQKLGHIPQDADIENMTMRDYQNYLGGLTNAAKLGVQQSQNEALNRLTVAKDSQLVDLKNPDGSIGKGSFNPVTQKVMPIEGSVVPVSQRLNQQEAQNFVKKITPDVLQTGNAIRNYDTALDNLNPQEAQKADDLARRQIGAIAGKFDQGVKANVITNSSQLLNTIAKMEQTTEFNTPENPAIGQAAFRRVKSALEFAAATQAGKTRPSNFATQFSLGNSFGSTIPGNPVPQEKIDELKEESKQNVGGVLQSALSGISNSELGKQKAQELFGDSADDYLNSYHNITGPGKKKTKSVIGTHVMSGDDYLKSLGQ